MLAVAVIEGIVRLLTRSHRTCMLLLVPGLEAARWRVGRWRAWRAFHRAWRQVPAYRRHLDAHGWSRRLGQSPPETDKAGYIQTNRIEDLCRGGRLPHSGVMLDESSGSSGTPTTWARGHTERRATASMLRATFLRTVGGGPVVVLNAFAMGAWATGLNVSMSLVGMCRIKSTGPDRDKIIATVLGLGRDHRYVVLGYPPFLKDLADDPRIDLASYDVIAGFGGEGLSENMRSYLLRFYRSVIGSYGASDLEINVAAETPFTIALRRELAVNDDLRTALTRTELAGEGERQRAGGWGSAGEGDTPMIFQYNPLDYVIETNALGELVVSVCRAANLSPRIRYNIHDVGHIRRMPELRRLLRRHGAAHLLALDALDLPVLFHYGRSDASLDYYGAVVTPDGLREALYAESELAGSMREFRLVGYEDERATPRLVFAVELQPGRSRDDLDERALATSVARCMGERNGDFANACRVAAADARPRMVLFAAGTGPFADAAMLKYRYVSRLDHVEARRLGLAEGPHSTPSASTSAATASNTASSPAYQPAARGQCATTSVKPSSAARPSASVNVDTLDSENTGAASSCR
jgi:phenylacetate-CoA ligase